MPLNQFPNVKLGKLAPRHDLRTLQFEAYVKPAQLPVPPKTESWLHKVPEWPMMLNDRYGDCTCAAAGHLIESWTYNVVPAKPFTPADGDVLTAYEAVSGFNPATGANDNGAMAIDVLNYWRNTGVGGHKITAYVALEPGNHNHIRESVYLFGGCYIGLQLPLSAQGQSVWSVPPGGPEGIGAPGSWGGHAVPIVAYDARALTVITWGRPLRMTWSFLDAYCDEAYAILSPDFFNDQQKAPDGFDLQALTKDLQTISEAPVSAYALVSGPARPVGEQVPAR